MEVSGSLTRYDAQVGVCAGTGTAGVLRQTAVRGRIRRLDPADLQRSRGQDDHSAVGVKGQRQVLPVLLPAHHGHGLARHLTA